ncbi:methyltransferase family protein [Brachybacterium phenoliresistens]|uniref:methyltransferase family protein n=1 Tax=Brachybacterium phenoliresistens TaxID=396014 RepID=UPI0004ADE99E|nr:isoprenylcysteine carboxylmethyltransferase family protein [Brachybacterium phenoliresistens]
MTSRASRTVHEVPLVGPMTPRRTARAYFALQSVAGALWWLGVATVPGVRTATLGELPALPIAIADVLLFVLGSALVALDVRRAVPVVLGWTALVALGMAVYATVTTSAGAGAVLMIAATVASVLAGVVVLHGRLPAERVLIGPLAFRSAPRRDRREHLAATFAQILVFWPLFLAIIPLPVVLLERRWRLDLTLPDGSTDGAALAWSIASWSITAAGALVLIGASALGLWAAYVMSTLGRGTPLPSAMPRALVIAGPYRWVRNPMAVSGVGQAVAVGMVAGSWMVVAYALAGGAIWHLLVRPHEERDLSERFGAPYEMYRSQVCCWIPRRRPLPGAPMPRGAAPRPAGGPGPRPA